MPNAEIQKEKRIEMSKIRIYENKTFKLNNLLKYELHSADENVKALHRVGTVCRREWQK